MELSIFFLRLPVFITYRLDIITLISKINISILDNLDISLRSVCDAAKLAHCFRNIY